MLDQSVQAVEILIVGFGFASIPLIRTLEERGQSYTIVSSGKTIWQRLKEKDKLDFNLVSSFHASWYAQDQVEDGRLGDFFPTASEFYEYHEHLYKAFAHKVVDDRVVSVDNFDGHSLVYTASGTTYQAHQVVFATGLGRPQNQTIVNWDYSSIRNQTVAFTTAGDTANMMISKLVPNGNKCILVTNGFMGLEKEISIQAPGPKDSNWWIPIASFRTGMKYNFDLAQMECHTMHDVLPDLWGRFMMIVGAPSPDSWLSRLVQGHQFFVKFPETFRGDHYERMKEIRQRGGAGWSNGTIGIKYHAIDMYKNRYAPNDEVLEDNIRRGVLMNDIAFFHNEGLVETWRKSQTTVDAENKALSMIQEDGTLHQVSFDHLVQGAAETPNLPPIYVVDSETGKKHQYQYNYRESLLGTVPSRLKNVYFMGLTRPTSGGAANLNEMQAMMTHKLMTDVLFREKTYASIHDRIRAYNYKYYHHDTTNPLHGNNQSPTDHLVFYGLYTREVAKFLGIERPVLRTCLESTWNPYQILRNLRFELLSPNNAIKYRMDGEYAVKGAKKFVRDIFSSNDELFIMNNALSCVLLDQMLYYQCVGMMAWSLGQTVLQHSETSSVMDQAMVLGLVSLPIVAIFHHIFRLNDHWNDMQTYSLPAIPFFGIKAYSQPFAMLYILMLGEWYWCFGIFSFWSVIAFLFRQVFLDGLQGRYLFGDMKWKHKYRPFWEQYKDAYHKVYEERRASQGSQLRGPK